MHSRSRPEQNHARKIHYHYPVRRTECLPLVRAGIHAAMKLRSPLLLDLAMWFATAAVFLSLYVGRFHNPAIVIAEHLYPVALIGACGMLVRVLISRLLPWPRLAGALWSLLWVSLLLALALYYWLVLTGLASWGKVITVELLGSYMGQAGGLFEAIGVSAPAVVLAAVVAWLAMVWGYAGLTRRLLRAPATLAKAAPEPAGGARRTLTTLLIFAAAILAAHRAYMYSSVPGQGSFEPFRLTLFAGKPGAFKENHQLVANARLDAGELDARTRYRAATAVHRKNVVLIVVDALRPDHLESYGYARATSPYLKSLVDQGKFSMIENVHSSCSASSCGLASLAGGRYAHQHPSNPFTLSQVLQLHGYSIRMLMGGDHTNFYNLREVYGKVDSYFDGSMATGYYMNDDSFLLDQTRQLQAWSGKPVMLQYHLMSSHVMGKRLDAYKKFTPSKSYATSMNSAPKQEFTNFYDNGVRQTDAMIEQLLKILGEKKYLDDAIVVITADHGDGLGEKGKMSHARGVDEEVLRIPLLIAGLPSSPAMAAPARPFIAQADIAPTILHGLGLPVPASWTGVALQVRQQSGRNTDLVHFRMNEYAGVFDGRAQGPQWKYWINLRTREEFLFDLSRDPHEHDNALVKASSELRHEWREAVTVDAGK